MIEMGAFYLYVVLTLTAVVLSLSGRVHLSLLILVPLLPLQNVLYRFHQYPLGNQFIDIVFGAM
ncbi:MAG: hypothetical protein ACYC5N_04615, partial [Endomicrobiales bacterium]